MKQLTLSLAFAALATPALADPVHGIWKTQPDDNGNYGHVQIGTCGETICGVLRQAFNGSGQQIESDNVGKQIIWAMKPRGDGAYRNGKVYAPDRDKTYNSKMDLSGNQLQVSGCVLGICRDSNWTRVQ